MRLLPLALLLVGFASGFATEPAPVAHSVFIAGAETAILSATGEVIWKYPGATRDGFVLPNGHLLLAISKNKDFPGGAVLEVTRDNQTTVLWKGTQDEVNTAQALPGGTVMLTEAGANPRILEVDRAGQIVAEVPIQAQATNAHGQSRMARKLPNGSYLVPQVAEKVVREYTPAGKIAWEYKAPAEPKECSPFTAIRLPDGHTLITLTRGTLVVEVDAAGEVVWQLSNTDLPTPLLNHPTAAQRLPNGNTVISSYGAAENSVKLFEVTRDKKVVWTLERSTKPGIHEFQILDTNGAALADAPMK